MAKVRPPGAPILSNEFIEGITRQIEQIREKYPDSLRASRNAEIGRKTAAKIRATFGRRLPTATIAFLQEEILEKVRAYKAQQTRAAKAAEKAALLPKVKTEVPVPQPVVVRDGTQENIPVFFPFDPVCALRDSLAMQFEAQEHIAPVDDEHTDLLGYWSTLLPVHHVKDASQPRRPRARR